MLKTVTWFESCLAFSHAKSMDCWFEEELQGTKVSKHDRLVRSINVKIILKNHLQMIVTMSVFFGLTKRKNSFRIHCGKKTLVFISNLALHLLILKIPDTHSISFI